MDGFTVSNSQRFLQTGDLGTRSVESQSILPKSENTNGTKSFAETLKEAVAQVNDMQKQSDKAIQNLATGRTDNIADVMIAAEKADIALRTMVQVRNKIIDAYNEVMKMQI